MSNCEYIFKRGLKKGEKCKIRPSRGRFCSKHKKYENKDHCIEAKVSYFSLSYLSSITKRFNIHWKSKILFCKNKKYPFGVYRYGNVYPLSVVELNFLKVFNLINRVEDYKQDHNFFYGSLLSTKTKTTIFCNT